MNFRLRRILTICLPILAIAILFWLFTDIASAQNPFPQLNMPNISINGAKANEKQTFSTTLLLLGGLSLLSLAPYILAMCTAFIRIVMTLSFLRSAMGTQQVPPTQVLMGLALFLTMFVMAPVGESINKDALQPYLAGKISQSTFFAKAYKPIQSFMLYQTREKDIQLFFDIGRVKNITKREDIPFYILLPSFVLSEIKTSFQIGFLLYVPFLIIDMVVASVLMSMGMFMLSPMSISLPFKLLLFVLIDGWHLIIKGVVESFNYPRS
ncbi:MAG: flagellar type III secretion system pore protein FliP [Candidatus Bruticola sp.]